jgi:hypothetical protein
MPLRTLTARTTAAGRAALLLATLCGLGFGLGGCANIGSASGNASMASAGSGPTVAFDSIDGPPPQVFDRMVSLLDSEARLRNLAVVSRNDQAAYRVRSYLAAQVSGGRTSIAWVWDVYDRDQQRAVRVSGEEQTAGKSSGRDAWATADDVVLRRIAQAGLSGLSAMVNGTSAPETPSAPPARGTGPAIASADIDTAPSDPAPSQVASFTAR